MFGSSLPPVVSRSSSLPPVVSRSSSLSPVVSRSSSLPPVVSRRVHVLFVLFVCVWWCFLFIYFVCLCSVSGVLCCQFLLIVYF